MPISSKLAEDWATVKYLSKSDGERKEKMEAVGSEADALIKRYPGRVEALIWDGIVTSERASLTWGLTALDLANACSRHAHCGGEARPQSA